MNNSMAHYFKVVAPYLDSSLVTHSALSSIYNLTQDLPNFPIAGIECRLGEKQKRVDFQGNITRYSKTFAKYFQSAPHLESVHNFCQEWSHQDSSMNKTIDDIWLEFDIDKQKQLQVEPCIIAALNQDSLLTFDRVKDYLMDLSGRSNRALSTKTIQNLALCHSSLVEDAKITYLGIMLSRTTPTVRVNIKGLTTRLLENYLNVIGWPGQIDVLTNLVDDVSRFTDYHVITFDIGDTILPRIGVECFLNRQPPKESRWSQLLDLMVDKGICTTQKKDALLSWPGLTKKLDQPESWPEELSLNDKLFESRANSLFWRTLSLIKIVYQDNILLSAKGYLAFGHRWFPKSKNEEAPFSNQNSDIYTHQTESKSVPIQNNEYLDSVRNYYNKMNPFYLKCLGKTYQAGLLKVDDKYESYYQSNLLCAQRAGIKSGQKVLDAGCGVCGPSIDIASSIHDLDIYAVTISDKQVKTAQNLIQQAKLSENIQIQRCDYHDLSFSDNTFDHVIFLESFGYSYNPYRLLSEAFRVLKPGGCIYIKDIFCRATSFNEEEKRKLMIFNEVYLYKTTTMEKIVEVIDEIGFTNISSCDVSDISKTKLYDQAMIENKYGLLEKSDLGEFHQYDFECLPIIFGEIKSCKPAKEA